jgi:replicative DNA helicase
MNLNSRLKECQVDNKQTYIASLEDIILCVMLNDPDAVNYVAERISSENFSSGNEELFTEILEVSTKQSDNDLLLVQLLKKFGADRIGELKGKIPVPSLSYLIKNDIITLFKDVVYSLQVENFLQLKLKEVKKDYYGLDTLLSLESDTQDLLRSKENFMVEKSFTDKLPEILGNIEKRLEDKSEYSFNIRTIPSFNIATGGILLSNLITVAGFTGQGKTFFSLNLCLDLAKQGIPVGFISLEQSETEIADRLIGMIGGIASNKLRNPKRLSKDEIQKITLPVLSKNQLPFYLNDRPLTEIEIKQKIKYWRDRFNVKVVCVDYLGLMQSRTKFTSRERELTYYSEFLKLTAKELDVVIIILTQLNRSGKLKPTIDNLAESIGLARDSDFLFTIYKPTEAGLKSNGTIKYDDSSFVLRCEKNRHNKNKKQILLKMKESGEFIELATEYDQQIDEIFDLNLDIQGGIN